MQNLAYLRWPAKLLLRLRSVFLRSRLDAELEEELCFHLEQQIAERIAGGANPEEARARRCAI